MTPHELSRQEEHLFAVLSGERFLKMEGLSNEVPFFIYPYEPEHALDVAKAKKRVKNRLAAVGVKVFEINLYDLSVELLKGVKPDLDVTTVLSGVTSPLTLALKICLVGGLVATCPVWLYQLWAFVAPGLYRREKRLALPLLTSALALFA